MADYTQDCIFFANGQFVVESLPVRPAAGEPGTIREQLIKATLLPPIDVSAATEVEPVIYRMCDYGGTTDA